MGAIVKPGKKSKAPALEPSLQEQAREVIGLFAFPGLKLSPPVKLMHLPKDPETGDYPEAFPDNVKQNVMIPESHIRLARALLAKL